MRVSTYKKAVYVPYFFIGGVALVICMCLAFGMDSKLYWQGDYGIFLIDMFNASHFNQAIGISSRFGWAHPGPINYYFLVPWFLMADHGDQSLLFGTFIYNCFFMGVAAYLLGRLSSKAISIIFLLLAVGYIYAGMGAGAFFDVLLPFATLFPWLLAMVVACAVVLRGLKYAALLAFVLTYVAQMHVAFWLPAAMLGVSACLLSVFSHKITAKDFLFLALGAVVCIFLWLPPLLEFNNLKAIFGFFHSRPSSEHTLWDAIRALTVLMGEPLLGLHLNYSNNESEYPALICGIFLLLCFAVSAAIAIYQRDTFGRALAAILFVQIITYLYALTKVTGPILHHSISFFPLVSIFIILQVVSLLSLNNVSFSRFAILVLNVVCVFFLAVVAPGLLNAVETAKQPDTAVESLYRSLSSKIAACSVPPTFIMNQDYWGDVIGAVSLVYRAGDKFTIYPPNWGIVFGGRISTVMQDCQISFSVSNGRLTPKVDDYANTSQYTSTVVLEKKNLSFSPYGSARIDPIQYTIQSAEDVDAGLVSQELTLPPGEYKLSADMAWDVTSGRPAANGAHLSFHGQRILWSIPTSSSSGSKTSFYFKSDGLPFRISFGLGGWSTGKGFVRLDNLSVVSIKER